MVEEAIERVGLPVTCSSCGEKGLVKPRTDYDGWYKRKLCGKLRWYCPPHSDGVRALVERLNERYKDTQPEPEPVGTMDELYKLLD